MYSWAGEAKKKNDDKGGIQREEEYTQ